MSLMRTLEERDSKRPDKDRFKDLQKIEDLVPNLGNPKVYSISLFYMLFPRGLRRGPYSCSASSVAPELRVTVSVQPPSGAAVQ